MPKKNLLTKVKKEKFDRASRMDAHLMDEENLNYGAANQETAALTMLAQHMNLIFSGRFDDLEIIRRRQVATKFNLASSFLFAVAGALIYSITAQNGVRKSGMIKSLNLSEEVISFIAYYAIVSALFCNICVGYVSTYESFDALFFGRYTPEYLRPFYRHSLKTKGERYRTFLDVDVLIFAICAVLPFVGMLFIKESKTNSDSLTNTSSEELSDSFTNETALVNSTSSSSIIKKDNKDLSLSFVVLNLLAALPPNFVGMQFLKNTVVKQVENANINTRAVRLARDAIRANLADAKQVILNTAYRNNLTDAILQLSDLKDEFMQSLLSDEQKFVVYFTKLLKLSRKIAEDHEQRLADTTMFINKNNETSYLKRIHSSFVEGFGGADATIGKRVKIALTKLYVYTLMFVAGLGEFGYSHAGGAGMQAIFSFIAASFAQIILYGIGFLFVLLPLVGLFFRVMETVLKAPLNAISYLYKRNRGIEVDHPLSMIIAPKQTVIMYVVAMLLSLACGFSSSYALEAFGNALHKMIIEANSDSDSHEYPVFDFFFKLGVTGAQLVAAAINIYFTLQVTEMATLVTSRKNSFELSLIKNLNDHFNQLSGTLDKFSHEAYGKFVKELYDVAENDPELKTMLDLIFLKAGAKDRFEKINGEREMVSDLSLLQHGPRDLEPAEKSSKGCWARLFSRTEKAYIELEEKQEPSIQNLDGEDGSTIRMSGN